MNSALKKIVDTAIYDQWIKGSKDLVMGYANKTFVELRANQAHISDEKSIYDANILLHQRTY